MFNTTISRLPVQDPAHVVLAIGGANEGDCESCRRHIEKIMEKDLERRDLERKRRAAQEAGKTRDVGREPRSLVDHVCLVDVALSEGSAPQVVLVDEKSLQGRAGPRPPDEAHEYRVTPLRWGIYEELFVLMQHTSGRVQVRVVDKALPCTEWPILRTEENLFAPKSEMHPFLHDGE